MPRREGARSRSRFPNAAIANGRIAAAEGQSRDRHPVLLDGEHAARRWPPDEHHRNGVVASPAWIARNRACVPVVIVGAGPFGLSLAAHLRAVGVEFRIFGQPMHTWLNRMPSGMLLKSEGFASDLYEPDRNFTLERFCAENSVSYEPLGWPIPLQTISAYGLAFQRRYVPGLEEKSVAAIGLEPDRFALRLEDGERLTAAHVVIATGFNDFEHVPESLAALPSALLSHSSAHRDLTHFAGQDVTVIGGGASAIDIAALLHAAGACVRLVARRNALVFNPPPELPPRPLWRQLRYPQSKIGNGLHSRFYADFPGLFRRLPEGHRVRVVREFLGPAAAWFIKPQIVDKVLVQLGYTPVTAEPTGSRVRIHFRGRGGTCHDIATDHVIAATGYRPDIRRLQFLSEPLRTRLRRASGAPALSSLFESSQAGLYFLGLASANCFGPVMRFMCGARFTAQTLASHLAKRSRAAFD